MAAAAGHAFRVRAAPECHSLRRRSDTRAASERASGTMSRPSVVVSTHACALASLGGRRAHPLLRRLLSLTLLQVLKAGFSDLHSGFEGAGRAVVYQELGSL